MKRKLLAALAAVAAIGCFCIGLYLYQQEKEAGAGYEEVRSEVKTEAPAEAEPEPVPESEEEKEPLDIPVDFEALQAECADIYAWITIPGTAVDYPIVQHPEDNGYYLDHDINGQKSLAGAIFTEDYNTTDFTDPNTVIYGHNMKNGSMFRSLHNYMDRSFFDENREVLIYLPDQILHYQIFAAYLYDSRHILQSFDFEDPQVFRQYLDGIADNRSMQSFVDRTMELTEEDRILTLSTCYKGQADKRYLVQAVLVSIETQ